MAFTVLALYTIGRVSFVEKYFVKMSVQQKMFTEINAIFTSERLNAPLDELLTDFNEVVQWQIKKPKNIFVAALHKKIFIWFLQILLVDIHELGLVNSNIEYFMKEFRFKSLSGYNNIEIKTIRSLKKRLSIGSVNSQLI